MLQTIKGYYDNGIVILEEQPKAKDKSPVYVMFIEDEIIPEKKTRKLGGLEGRLKIPDDFNEPLNYNAIIPKKGGMKLGGLEGKLDIPDDFDESINFNL